MKLETVKGTEIA